MIGIVLVTHAGLGAALLSVTEHIVGEQPGIRAIPVDVNDDPERCRERILETIRAVSEGDGVILLTDMFGGTPSNLAISVMKAGEIEVVAGVNLPMMIRLASARRTLSLTETVNSAQEAGKKYINSASAILSS